MQYIAHTKRETSSLAAVDGAFAESESWNGVVAGLGRRGYPVVANPLRGSREDAEHLRGVLDSRTGLIVRAVTSAARRCGAWAARRRRRR